MVYGRMVRDDPPPYFRFTLSCNRNCPDHRLFACKVKYAFGAKSAEGEDDWVKWSNTEPAAAVHFFASNNLRECGLDFVYTTMSVGIEIVWSAHGTWSVNGIMAQQKLTKKKKENKSIFKILYDQYITSYF
jgi:hypothetical protein